MITIGVPKEIKNHEYRVALTPDSAQELVQAGHKVIIETKAGEAIGLTDEMYKNAGATIMPDAKSVFSTADMIIKVKEPQPQECKMLRDGQVLFTYLHLAPDPEQAKLLKDSNCIAIAYETVTDQNGQLPLLAPMSEVAGRMAIQAGAHCLEKAQGGRGVLLGGVPGVAPGNVLIIGGGVVGTHAAQIAIGIGANVTILDRSLKRLKELDQIFGGRAKTLYSNAGTIDACLREADMVVGAVLIPGANAPRLIKKAHLKTMKPGSVIVDVAIDQGGCAETSHATTHQDPTYVIDGIIHYCVANMPGGVASTSTFALNNATLPFSLALANKGYKRALLEDPHLMNGLNVYRGQITHAAVAEALGDKFRDPYKLLDETLTKCA